MTQRNFHVQDWTYQSSRRKDHVAFPSSGVHCIHTKFQFVLHSKYNVSTPRVRYHSLPFTKHFPPDFHNSATRLVPLLYPAQASTPLRCKSQCEGQVYLNLTFTMKDVRTSECFQRWNIHFRGPIINQEMHWIQQLFAEKNVYKEKEFLKRFASKAHRWHICLERR
jgi:hypothetical protein